MRFQVNGNLFYSSNPFVEKNCFLSMDTEEAELPLYENIKEELPQPVWDGHESVIDCYYKAWELAFGNLRKAKRDAGFVSNFIDTAFNGYLFMWDSSFIVMFGKYANRIFNFQKTLDNFYSHQHRDGFICREICESEYGEQFSRDDPASTGPNILAWAEWEYFQSTGDLERLEKVFWPLCGYYRWLMRHRSWQDGSYWSCGLACGMDNQPRVDEGYDCLVEHGFMSWIDACAQQCLSAGILLKMGEVLGSQGQGFGLNWAALAQGSSGVLERQAQASGALLGRQAHPSGTLLERQAQTSGSLLGRQAHGLGLTQAALAQGPADWLEQQAQSLGESLASQAQSSPLNLDWLAREKALLSRTINDTMWSDQDCYYFDKRRDGTLTGVKSIGAYWTLLADLVPRERLDSFVEHLDNEAEFRRPHRVPSLSADHSEYNGETGGYWRGGVWAPTNYMVLCGLRRHGYESLAHEIALNSLRNTVAVFEKTGTLFENYAPESAAQGEAKADFVGWTGLIPISILFEYVFGIQPDSMNNKIIWHINLLEKHGVKGYPFGDATVDLICEARKDNSEKPRIKIISDKKVFLEIIWQNGSEILYN